MIDENGNENFYIYAGAVDPATGAEYGAIPDLFNHFLPVVEHMVDSFMTTNVNGTFRNGFGYKRNDNDFLMGNSSSLFWR